MPHADLTRREALLTSTAWATLAWSGSAPWAHAQGPAEKKLSFLTTDPRNAEPALADLLESWITPTKHFYVRSHAPNPELSGTDFRLRIEGLVRRPLSISLGELAQFPRLETIATLTCAGNRRAEFNREGKVGGVQWNAGAIGNARWAGVSLGAVLAKAEVLESARHVWFEGLDEIAKGEDVIPFGGSIPIDKAMQQDTAGAPLLATEMNEAPLSRDHGFPLRTVVPGYIGARSVKWLGRIVVSDRPSPNHYLATAYKIVKATNRLDWEEAGPIYRYPINAAICTPAPRERVSAGMIKVAGYALPSGRAGSRLSRVEVSADGGKTWVAAQWSGEARDFCWQLWQADVPVIAQTKRLTLRARDTAGYFTPGRVPWNAKGYLQNSWYQLPIRVS